MSLEASHNTGEPLESGIPPNCILFKAIKSGNRRDVFDALRLGADPSQKHLSNKSFLRLAGEAGSRDICELLMRGGADPNEVYGQRGLSLLHFATTTGNYGFASTLLQFGAQPSPKSHNGVTPLHIAVRTGQQYLVAKLIQYNADVKARDSAGRNPLDLAFEKGDTDIINLLRSDV